MLFSESSLFREVLYSGRTSRWPLLLVQLRFIRKPRRANRRSQALKPEKNIVELLARDRVPKDIVRQALEICLGINEIPGTQKN